MAPFLFLTVSSRTALYSLRASSECEGHNRNQADGKDDHGCLLYKSLNNGSSSKSSMDGGRPLYRRQFVK